MPTPAPSAKSHPIDPPMRERKRGQEHQRGKADEKLFESRPYAQHDRQHVAQRELEVRWRDVAVVSAAHEQEHAGGHDHDTGKQLIDAHRRSEHVRRPLDARIESPIEEVKAKRDERGERENEPHAAETLDLLHRERRAHHADDDQRTRQRHAQCEQGPAQTAHELIGKARRRFLTTGRRSRETPPSQRAARRQARSPIARRCRGE